MGLLIWQLIWKNLQKSPNLIPPILYCVLLLAHHSSTYDYALYQYLKIAVYSPENVTLGIPLSPGMNFVSLMRHTLWEADCSREALQAWSCLEMQEVATHQRRGQGWEVVAMKTAWPRPSTLSLRSQATVLGQL